MTAGDLPRAPTTGPPDGRAATPSAYERETAAACGAELRAVRTNGTTLQVAVAGEGPPVVLLHGWPHTWLLWRRFVAPLARHHRVLVPDLRGIGGSARPAAGYDLHTLADDVAGVLAQLGDGPAGVVGIDAGAPVAWMLGARHPDAVGRVAVMESLLGSLPGAEGFLAAGPPWWFGFHAVPGLAEELLEGREAQYLDWFYAAGTAGGRGVEPALRDAFVTAYRGREGLRGGFELYRAMAQNAAQIEAAVADPSRPQVPTLAIAGGVVGDALHRQLAPITVDLVGRAIADSGHIVPEDQPAALLALLEPFLGATG
jgi:pimeloyl-ACP methyl ester carboxylesterase